MKERNIDQVVNGSITISGLMAGFMLVFIGLLLDAEPNPNWIKHTSIFFATAFMEYFYRAMAKGWNISAIRTMYDVGDDILEGKLTSGSDYAAFRALWSFQPKLFQGSWFLLIVICLYGASKSEYYLISIISGFFFGLLYYSISGERRWLKTWKRCSRWDRAVMLGEELPISSLPWQQRIFARVFYPKSIKSNFIYDNKKLK